MKRKQIFNLLSTATVSLLLAVSVRLTGPSAVVAQSSNNLTISAAGSLKDALEEIKTLYQQTQPNINITYNFGASGALTKEIEKGKQSDIFISTSKKQVDGLEEKGLIVPKTRSILANNRLVLIVPKDNSVGIRSFYTLANSKVKKIAIGDPKSVPAGQYAQDVFKKLGILDKVKPKFVYEKNAKQVLASVENGNADAGLGYSTDAKSSDKVKVAVATEGKYYSPIIYPLAILKTSQNVEAAKGFVKFLSSDPAKSVLKKYGFIVK
ncbi:MULTISPECIES: molybdate ABC transporter substrate-binding protein [Nostocales]|uniref:Molybdate ABC transporter substrate-binding protein n=3 Tax=Nostocales TaxID=1161 RepID=A0A0C1QUG8_9CYAN|nr:molybdate ABC transporter substrate-binding protein [Tolypothrix bouteillei]KAF3885155.1 molybdate ABC transporter substrate-binding protein [Tolypothrix bouteillei VB521301]